MKKQQLRYSWTIKILLGLMVLLPVKLFAVEQQLVTISNEENDLLFEFVVDVDEQTQDIQIFYKDSFKKGEQVKQRETLPLKPLHDEGLVLEKREGRDVILLKSSNFAEHNGGHITLDTLYNGATGSRKMYEFELARTSDGWEITRDGRPFKKLHLVSKKVFPLGTVGIANIQTK